MAGIEGTYQVVCLEMAWTFKHLLKVNEKATAGDFDRKQLDAMV